jgi:hypothetical protein
MPEDSYEPLKSKNLFIINTKTQKSSSWMFEQKINIFFGRLANNISKQFDLEKCPNAAKAAALIESIWVLR